MLRATARQLASALAAVHAAGKLHRDIKPSNILVTSAGRAVLFDFGLAASLCSNTRTTKRAGALLGTRGYISPEQARGEALSTAADWYSFGVTLFEAVTGHLPFEDGFRSFLPDRDAEGLGHIGRFVSDAPSDLGDLIAGLLRPAPERRPSEDDIFGVFDDPHRSGNRPRSNPPQRPSTACPVDVVGPELALALERVQQQALDEVVDELSHVLEHMPYGELISVLPPDMAALPRLFPVLGRLEAVSDFVFVKRTESTETEAEAMLRARGAFKELVAGLAERRPIVIWIDEVEKGDRESGELLGDLLEPPDEQPVLLVLSYRSEVNRGETLDALADRAGNVPSFDLTVPEAASAPHGRCA